MTDKDSAHVHHENRGNVLELCLSLEKSWNFWTMTICSGKVLEKCHLRKLKNWSKIATESYDIGTKFEKRTKFPLICISPGKITAI